jgi:hypothetical protein
MFETGVSRIRMCFKAESKKEDKRNKGRGGGSNNSPLNFSGIWK